MNYLISKAHAFATGAHGAIGQKRKYTGEDYIVHPRRVAETIIRIGGSGEMIAAAYLHDVVEDTQVSGSIIKEEFGTVVYELVMGLTDVSKPGDGNRKLRKSMDAVHTASASREVQIIKLADLIDNTTDIVRYDPWFAKVYLEEKATMLTVMDKVHDHELFTLAQSNWPEGYD